MAARDLGLDASRCASSMRWSCGTPNRGASLNWKRGEAFSPLDVMRANMEFFHYRAAEVLASDHGDAAG